MSERRWTETKKNSYFLNLGTVTFAHKAKKLLEDNGISATVGKIPSGESGCSYGVYVKGRSKDDVILLLRSHSLKIL